MILALLRQRPSTGLPVWSLTVALLAAWPVWAFAQAPTPEPEAPPPAEEQPLPKLNELTTPTAEELLRGKPTDWLVLLNQDVIMVDPVKPRPDALATLKNEYERIQKIPTTQLPLEEKQAKLAELQRLPVTLHDNSEDPEYVIETRFIDQIIYFEDHLLKRTSLLLDQGDLVAAYELLMLVDRRHRGWPGFDEQYHRFLFLEAQQLTVSGQLERALVTAEQLFALKSDYPDLSRQMGRIVDALMSRCIAIDDFRQARHFLARLSRLQADHTSVAKWTDALTSQARDSLQSARQAQRVQDHRQAVLLVDHAARIWPNLPNLRDAHREMVDRYQILRVGIVAEQPRSGDYPFATPTDDRRQRLCRLRLFEEDQIRDGVVRYRSRFLESWEPRNLGREIHFRLTGRRADWESRPVITSGEIVDTLATRLDEGQPEFDARRRREVTSVSARSPTEWTLSLSRIPLRIESRLRFDIPLSDVMLSRTGDLTPAALEDAHQQRFFMAGGTENQIDFRRTRAQPAGPDGWHIAEVIETTYPTWERSLQGLLRGEVDLLPRAEWTDVAAIAADNRFFVHQEAVPRSHFLQIHPKSVLAGNSSLRKALLHALDRPRIFKTAVVQEKIDPLKRLSLATAESKYGRLVTSPFPTVLFAYDKLLRQPEVDPLRAASLVATARRQLMGNLPTLKLAVPGDVVSSRAISLMIADWKRVGLSVEVQSPDDAGLWDLAYRTAQLAEPTDDIWSLLHPDGDSSWDHLGVYPHWVRERLWELEQAIDLPTAMRILQQIQAEFLMEARWIPLWEVDDYVVARRRMVGLQTRPMHPYQDIERWTLLSWYPTETP